FGLAENTYDLFVGKTLLHGDVLMWLMKTLLTSRCINQRGAGHQRISKLDKSDYHSNPNERLLIKCCGDQWHSKRPVDERYPSLTAIKLVD
ncbi:hypothetical protein KJR81_24175, partial [Klebsiella pneumoniae]